MVKNIRSVIYALEKWQALRVLSEGVLRKCDVSRMTPKFLA